MLWLAVLIILALPTSSAAAVTLFQNDFESPVGIIIPFGCCGDASQQNVNTLYGTSFQQTNTVETLAINGPQNVYSDPDGIGGNFALGMLESVQNDLLSLTFDTAGLRFLNLSWDIAAVGIDQPGGLPSTPTFLTGASTYTLTLFNTPGGVFNINSPGSFTALDQQTVTGTAPTSDGLTFDWSHHIVALDALGSTDGKVTLLIDLTAGGYGAFDNILIAASDIAGEVPGARVPEPSTLFLLATGLAAAAVAKYRGRARR
jgi:PEP-CTERM motif-containing protein